MARARVCVCECVHQRVPNTIAQQTVSHFHTHYLPLHSPVLAQSHATLSPSPSLTPHTVTSTHPLTHSPTHTHTHPPTLSPTHPHPPHPSRPPHHDLLHGDPLHGVHLEHALEQVHHRRSQVARNLKMTALYLAEEVGDTGVVKGKCATQ